MTYYITKAARDILEERARQIKVEGWSPELDDDYVDKSLAEAAACYALAGEKFTSENPPEMWPWNLHWWKPTNHRRNLIKAGALILAEIERLDRSVAMEDEK